MTREEAKQLLPVIQAFAQGKTIQFKIGDFTWEDCGGEPSFVWPGSHYRVKPELMDRWVNLFSDGGWGFYETEAEAKKDADGMEEESDVKLIRTVHLREVVP